MLRSERTTIYPQLLKCELCCVDLIVADDFIDKIDENGYLDAFCSRWCWSRYLGLDINWEYKRFNGFPPDLGLDSDEFKLWSSVLTVFKLLLCCSRYLTILFDMKSSNSEGSMASSSEDMGLLESGLGCCCVTSFLQGMVIQPSAGNREFLYCEGLQSVPAHHWAQYHSQHEQYLLFHQPQGFHAPQLQLFA